MRVAKASRQLFDKDILRVGQWRVGERDWWVDLWTLRRLVINFQRGHDRGIRVPVVWNHSSDARDKIGEVVRIYLEGETLRARFWAVSAADVERLEGTGSEVSVEVVEDWVDGKGRPYDLFLTHLAVVTHPVVHPQGPVYRLSVGNPMGRSTGGDGMTESETELTAVATETPTIESNWLDEVVALIHEIVEGLGASLRLPAETSLSTFVEQLRSLRDQVEALSPVDRDPAVSTHRLSLEEHRRADLFRERVERLMKEGRLLPVEREGLLEAGRANRYALSLLDPLERLLSRSVLPMDPVARRRGGGGPSAPRGSLGAEELARLLRAYREHA
jgi:hypothetical protein